MTEEFTASNGITIYVREGGTVQFQHGTREESCGILQIFPHSEWWQTLREFFQAEADERLGRWRWPENPDYVVYPIEGEDGVVHTVRVLRESTSATGFYYRTDSGENTTEDMGQPARAYFDAHPEPKPWHDATEGEVWVITFSEAGGGTTEPWTMSRHGLFEHPNYGSRIRVKDSTIISARKIWPQDEPTVDDLSYDA